MVAGRPPHAIVLAGARPASARPRSRSTSPRGSCATLRSPATGPAASAAAAGSSTRGSHADLHRLAPAGPGNQVRIGDRDNPEPGTVRRLISDLALLPVEGGARVAIIERADRLNEDAQSALLKTSRSRRPA